MMKKIAAALAAIVLVLGLTNIFAGATEPAPKAAAPDAASAGGSVYYLNFKPEQAAQWEKIAREYTAQTGTAVTVLTAASGTYEDTLRSEMEKNDPPTLFQVNGPTGLKTWKEYCLDLRDTALVQNLKSDEFILFNGEEAAAVAYAIETYGLIFNRTLLERAGYAAEDIDSFESLKRAAEDIQSRKEELGIAGAFTSAGMDASSDWRFKTHLVNLPLYYEYKARGVDDAQTLTGEYLPQLQQIWDLYLHNATCPPAMIGAKTGEDAASEFALGEAVFYQNGTWAYADCTAEGLTDADLGMLPIYIGAAGEEQQGLCTGSENYWCINRHAAPEDIEATKAFVEWLITSEEGKTAMAQEMGFATPFSTFDDAVDGQNALQRAAQAYLDAGYVPVSWAFVTIPSETWKNNVGAAMLEYAQGTAGWEEAERAFTEGWASENAALN